MENRLVTNWRISLIAIFCASVFLYLPTLTGGAIWDDTELISGTGFGKNTILSAFTHPFLKIYFRPLTSASFVMDSSFANSTPFFYHQTNILLHAATAVFVACLTLAVTQKQLPGILAGLFFAAQPVQVDAAAWIGGRTDVLSAFFLAAMMLGLVQYHQTSKKAWLVLSVITFLLAALSKEQAVAILPAVPLSVFVFGTKKWSDAGKIAIPFGVATVVFFGMWAIGAPAPVGAHGSLVDTVTVALRTTALYGTAFLVPNNRSLMTWTLENYRSPLWMAGGLILIVATVWFLRYFWTRNRSMAWLAICGLLVYFPISNLLSVPTIVVAPYRCAEAGTAVACLLGAGLGWAVSTKRFLVAVPLAANLVGGVVVANWGIHVWTSEYHFFDTAAHNDPHFIAGVTHYAEGLNGENRWKESMKWTNGLLTWLFGTEQWAHQIETNSQIAQSAEVRERIHTNVGNPDPRTLGYLVSLVGASLADMNRKPEAIRMYQDALVVAPTDPRINFAYGKLIVKSNRKEAIAHWETALRVSPKFPVCAAALAHERVVDGRFKDAVDLLEPSMATVGWNSDPWIDLADAKIGLHDYAGAAKALDEAGKAIMVIKPKIQDRRRKIKQLLAH